MHALLFDLDGTLVDTVYAHVLAWQRALGEVGVAVDGYRLHRHVGSSGELIVRFAQREAGQALSAEQAATVHRRHEELFRQIVPRPRALPGAIEVFRALRSAGIPHVIATANYRPLIDASLDVVRVGPEAVVVEGKGELHGKPEPGIFLASRERLKVQAADCAGIGVESRGRQGPPSSHQVGTWEVCCCIEVTCEPLRRILARFRRLRAGDRG
jgi:beta-phosphoglucomutase-like phosphatase (HAD superfamily)